MNFSVTCLLLVATIACVAGDCWWTSDCQANSWQTKGCAQYGRTDNGTQACQMSTGEAGQKYYCCTPPAGSGAGLATGAGKTTRYWDCCKPSCSWDGKATVSRPVKTCAANGVDVLATSTASGCDGGSAYTCNNNQPFVKNNTAYGFVAGSVQGQAESRSCCACYELTFTSSTVVGQKMVVQVTNTGSDLSTSHFDIQIPGGGVGIFNGCSSQWGAPSEGWGARYGGVNSAADCSQLPSQLQAGCQFRFGWFKNADNPTMTYKEVTCPTELTSISGCIRS